MQIVRYVMWFQLVGQRPETAWAALSWSSVWLRKAEMCFCVRLNVCFPVAPPGLQQPASVTQIFIVPESTTDEKGCLWQRMMEREAGQFLCVWVCVINPQRDLSCCVSLSVCVFLFWDLTVRFSVSWSVRVAAGSPRSGPFPQHHPSGMPGTRAVCLTSF